MCLFGQFARFGQVQQSLNRALQLMLWPKADFDAAYDKIKQEALSGGCTVLVLLAPTCDSMCAGRILTVSCVTAYFARWVSNALPCSAVLASF